MDSIKEHEKNDQQITPDEQNGIDTAMRQMEVLYKSRCVQPPFGTNVTIREIEKDK